jgi:chromosome segregation ATPase
LELQKEVIQLKQDLKAVETQQSHIDTLERQLSQARSEADAARNVMLNNFDSLSPRTPTDSTDYDGRIRTLQEHLDKTKSLHAESREAHDNAIKELATAHERIAFLETTQSQSVREIATLQTRLSESLDQLQSLQGEHSKVRTRMVEVQRDLDATHVKHSAIKQLFSERPSSSSPLRSNKSGTSHAEFISCIETT